MRLKVRASLVGRYAHTIEPVKPENPRLDEVPNCGTGFVTRCGSAHIQRSTVDATSSRALLPTTERTLRLPCILTLDLRREGPTPMRAAFGPGKHGGALSRVGESLRRCAGLFASDDDHRWSRLGDELAPRMSPFWATRPVQGMRIETDGLPGRTPVATPARRSSKSTCGRSPAWPSELNGRAYKS